jgi:hypothetical protein
LSLLATLGVVVAIVLMVPRDDSLRIQKVDYQSIAADAAMASNFDILAPELPTGWWANQAKWSGSPADAVPAFSAGFVGPENEYLGVIQGFGGNETWLALKLQGLELTGALPTSDGSHWDIYKSKQVHDPVETWDHAMVINIRANDYVILYGTATDAQFDEFATAFAESENDR